MTAFANFTADDLLTDYQLYETVSAFLEGKEAGELFREVFPFGMVYETLERAFAQFGNPPDDAVLPQFTSSSTAPSAS